MNSKSEIKKVNYLHKVMNGNEMRAYMEEARTNDKTYSLVTQHIGYAMAKAVDPKFNFLAFKTLVDDTFDIYLVVQR